MFLIKKIVSYFLYPLPFSTLVVVAGIVLLWFTRRQKAGKTLVSVGMLFLLASSYDPLPTMLVENLETQFIPLAAKGQQNVTNIDGLPSVVRVVVLGGGHVADPHLPATGQLSAESLARLVEGVRLYKALPQGTLILSGGVMRGGMLHGAVMAAAARELDVPARDILVGKPAQDTRGEAVAFQRLLGDEPFVLVTSASHMPRAVALFTKLGMRPLPAPSDYLIKHAEEKRRWRLGTFFPSPRRLERTTKAVHEYLGILWAKLTGQA